MSSARTGAIAAVLVAFAATFLFFRTFVPTGWDAPTPVLLGGDQGFFWMYGERMLRGDLPYRDFFQFTLPGADLAHLAAFALFGPRVWVTAALVVALGTALTLVFFSCARGVLADREAALATAVFVVLVFGQALTTTHHWWSMLFVMAAVRVASPASDVTPVTRIRPLASAGALLGLASFCTQTHGIAALAGFAAFEIWRGRRHRLSTASVALRVASLGASFSVTLLLAISYFLVRSGVAPVWSCAFTYVALHMRGSLPGWSSGLPEAVTWRSLPALAPFLFVDAMVPAAYVLAAGELRDGAGDATPTRERAARLWFVGVALLAEVMLGLSWVRLFAVAWPSVILLVRAVDLRWRRAYVSSAWVGVLVLAAILVRSTHKHHSALAVLPGGTAAMEPSTRDELAWLSGHAPPSSASDSLFAADHPSLYLPLGLRSPVYLDAVVPGSERTSQTPPELAQRTVEELEAAETPYVLWKDVLSTAGESPHEEGLRLVLSYLQAHFKRVRVFDGGDEAWERAPATSP